ncbi:MAG TPA: protein kinase [Terriglobales bacterium]|nr:protein kinase [Terriglobales bacterium]
MKYCDICHQTYPTEFTTCPRDQSPLRTTTELLQGMVLRGKYEIQEKLGAGGMATVYLAKHKAFSELRAIKVVSSRNLEDQNFIRRFKTEAVITRKLQHPNAVRVDDLDETEDGRPFIVMEYVQGANLRSTIQNEGPLPVKRALNIAAQAAAALAAAHELGITHRDIKPDNILLIRQPDGSDLVKVLDFGIAKVREGSFDIGAGYTATQTGLIIGTPQYISPEQAKGEHGDQIDGRADLYSLGIVLYEMVTGQLPFQSQTAVGMLMHHLQTPAPDPKVVKPDLNIPPALSALLQKALEKDPANRYQTAQDMLRAIQAVQQSLGEGKTTMVLTPEAWNASPSSTTANLPAPAAPTTRSTVYSPAKTQPATAPQPKPATAARPAQARAKPAPPKSGKGKWIALAVVVIGVLLVLGKMQRDKLATNTNPAPQPTPTVASHEPATHSAPDDAAITTEIQRAIAATEWAKEASINVGVKDGNVTLTGKAPRHYDADMAGAIAANISGVKLVHNEIAVPTPTPAPTQVAQIPTKPTKTDNSQQKKQEAALKQRVDQLIQTGVFQRENRQFGGAMQSFRDALKLDPGNQQAVTEIKNTVKAAGLAGNQAGQPQQNQNVPLKFWQVRAMLEAKMVPQKIVGAVRLRGVDFGLTSDQEQTLRDAGANDGLIRVIHNNRR